MNNFFTNLPARSSEVEQFSLLLKQPGIRIERIVSNGQRSPEGFWYDQPEHEWVMVLQGEAGLRLAEESQVRHLKAGDFLNIPAHCKHRVEWTTSEQSTIWLAVHYAQPDGHTTGNSNPETTD